MDLALEQERVDGAAEIVDDGVALERTYLRQASAEHLQQCAEFLPLSNRGLGPLAVTILPILLAGGPPLPFAPAIENLSRSRVPRHPLLRVQHQVQGVRCN